MKDEAIKHLNNLELEPGADFQSVKNSYKLLSMAWHPDRFSSEKHKTKAEDKQKKINAAYHWLKNNQEILSHLNEKPPNKNSKQKSYSNSKSKSKSKKQSTRNTYNRSSKSSYNRLVKTDGHFLKFEDQKYDINLIKRATLNMQSKKYIRGIGYILYLLAWLFFILTIASIFSESINTGLTVLILFFVSMPTALILVFIKDVVKIDLILNNKKIVTTISYKVLPNSNESEKKYRIARSLVNEINNVIENKYDKQT